jgi:hypothetical protein
MRVCAGFSRLLLLPGVWVRSVEFEPDRVIVGGALRRRRLQCPRCSCLTWHREQHQRHDSSWRHLDLGGLAPGGPLPDDRRLLSFLRARPSRPGDRRHKRAKIQRRATAGRGLPLEGGCGKAGADQVIETGRDRRTRPA